MEKLLKIVNIIINVASHVCGVVVVCLGATGIAISVNSRLSPNVMARLPRIFILMAVFVAIKVLFGLLNAIGSGYMDSESKKYSTISFCCIITALTVYLNPVIGIITAIGFVTVAGMIPVANAISVNESEFSYLRIYNKLNYFMRDISNAIDDILQYRIGNKAMEMFDKYSDELSDEDEELLRFAKNKQVLLALSISFFAVVLIGTTIFYYTRERIDFEKMLVILSISIFSLRESVKIRS